MRYTSSRARPYPSMGLPSSYRVFDLDTPQSAVNTNALEVTILSALSLPERPFRCFNLIDGERVSPSGERREVASPYFGLPLGEVADSTAADVDQAVSAAHKA